MKLIDEIRESLFLFLANNLPRLKVFDRWRWIFLRLAGIHILGKCTIWAPIDIRPIGAGRNVLIGKDCFINSGVRFAAPRDNIHIGNNVAIGPRVCFETVNHNLSCENGEKRGNITKSIIIEDDVWIGAGCLILQGVKVGKGSVIAAGSVINRDVRSYSLYGGVPGKYIKTIPHNNN